MRQQFGNLTRTLRRQARENVLQIGVRIMTIQPRRLDQVHDRRSPFSAAKFHKSDFVCRTWAQWGFEFRQGTGGGWLSGGIAETICTDAEMINFQRPIKNPADVNLRGSYGVEAEVGIEPA